MRKGEARKQAITETAEALFLKRGYDNTRCRTFWTN
jgi:AcrR family transcriptional regulator